MALAYVTQKQADWAVDTIKELLRDWNRQQFAMEQTTKKLNHALTLLPIGEYAETSPYYQLRGAINAAIKELSL